MGDVFLAHRTDGEVQQTRAVKVLREVYQDGQPDEADTLGALDHPNIARCFDAGLTGDGHRYLVMEYVDGLPITDYADQQALSIHDRLELFMGACAAVEYSHQRLVLHLDLKPGNILVNRSGAVKVVDFGIARRLESRARSRPDGAFSGPYASPELLQPEANLVFRPISTRLAPSCTSCYAVTNPSIRGFPPESWSGRFSTKFRLLRRKR